MKKIEHGIWERRQCVGVEVLYKIFTEDLSIKEICEQRFEGSEGVSLQILGERAEQTTVFKWLR